MINRLAAASGAPDIELVLARRIEIGVTAGCQVRGHGNAHRRQGGEREKSKTDAKGLHEPSVARRAP